MSASAPAVSIVVPCYNGGRFLDDLLANLARQTFHDFEIIIVDDGSTDPATRDKLDTLDAGVRVIRQHNRGLSGARNTGFGVARGAFVLPLDCDDGLDPAFLDRAMSALAANAQAAFAFAHMQLTGSRSGVLERHYDPFDQLFLNQLPYCLLMRKCVHEKIGGYDETMRDGYEDWEFNIRLVKADACGVEIPEPLFLYRVSPEGMLLSRSARLHGALWRRIREKHSGLYTAQALVRAYRKRHARRKVSATAAVALLLCARLLPDAWFGALFHRLLSAAQGRRGKEKTSARDTREEARHADT